MVAGFKDRSDIDVRVGLLSSHTSNGTNLPTGRAGLVAFNIVRKSPVRSVMLRAALGGPLTEAENAFLSACAEESKECDVAIWLGLSWDPVSLSLPRVCACPVIHHATDSISLAEINRLPGSEKWLRIKVARSLERRVLNAGYVKVVYNSPQDSKQAVSLLSGAEDNRVATLPIGVDPDVFYPERVRIDRRPLRVILSGVMNYRPNVDAALALVRDILPHIRADVEIAIVGRDPTPDLMELSVTNANVVVTGAVLSLADELRRSDIFAAPMVSGGGISNKVLEALSCGLPVVVTPLVADNFPDKPEAMRVAKGASDFASAIDDLAADAGLRSRLSLGAAEYIRAGTWSWQSRSDRLFDVLQECAETESAIAGRSFKSRRTPLSR